MIEKMTESDVLKYRPLTEEEKSRGILGRLFGNVADTFRATRNGRKYSEELWEKVFNDPLVKEEFEMGGIPGELDHPTDRVETCSEKIAIMMPKPPKKGSDGKLVAYFDILDTPNGKIAYTLAKYGYKFGISSRGDGEVEENYDGTSDVVPNSFDFKAFDLVLLPAVKEARMRLVAESFDTKGSVRGAILEALNSSSEEDKKIMEDTLTKLNIDYKPEEVDNNACERKDEAEEDADNVGSEIVEDLQVALKEKKALEDKVAELHEKLSVCYAKEVQSEEATQERQKVSAKLAEATKLNNVLTAKNGKLVEQLKQACAKVRDIKMANAQLVEAKRKLIAENEKQMNESVAKYEAMIADMSKKVKVLESMMSDNESAKQVQTLTENVSALKRDATIKNNEYSRKIAKANALTEQYKSIADVAVDKYIGCQAVKLGVSSEEIKARLGESYSFEDIDRLCESIQSKQVRDNRLPFSDSRKSNLSISVNVPAPKQYAGYDDSVDESLIALANHFS